MIKKKKIGLRNTFAVTGSEIVRQTPPVEQNMMLKNHGLLNHHLSFNLPPLSLSTARQ